jgi:hypothetical protein
MKIINIAAEVSRRTDDVYVKATAENPRPNQDAWHKARSEAHAAVIAENGCEIEPGTISKIEYDSKTDRYTVTFLNSERTMKMRVSNDVAQFIFTHVDGAGYWRVKMENGIVTDAVKFTM